MNKTGYIFPGPVQYYLADLFAVPVVATLSMWFTRWTIKAPNFVLTKAIVIFIVLLFSILFELLLPLIMKRYTSDVIDILMYIIGGVFFLKVMNKP